jgi:hypothetical protein
MMIAPLNFLPAAADIPRMTSPVVIALFLVVWAVLMRAMAAATDPARRACARCGRPFERRHLGEPVCRCHE